MDELKRLINEYEKRLRYKKSTAEEYRRSNNPELKNSVSMYEKEIAKIELILKGLYRLMEAEKNGE